jgi:hypothetical protein
VLIFKLSPQLFKTYDIQSLASGLTFVQDLKLGHYMKIPPRATFMGAFSFPSFPPSLYVVLTRPFTVQVVATFTTALVQVGVKRWLVHAVKDLCAPGQRALLTCPYAGVLYSSSVVWCAPSSPFAIVATTDFVSLLLCRGLIGPARQFSVGKYYNPILYWLLAGALLPAATWVASRRFKNTWVQYINVPVALSGIIYVPPASGINYSSWFFVAFIFRRSPSLPFHENGSLTSFARRIPHAPSQLSMVVEVHLPPLRRYGRRHNSLWHRHLPYPSIAEEWLDLCVFSRLCLP